MIGVPFKERLGVALLLGCAVVTGVIVATYPAKPARGQSTMFAMCTVSPDVATKGQAAVFDVSVYNSGAHTPASYSWSYPNSIASCGDFGDCATGPLSQSISKGEFSVSVSMAEQIVPGMITYESVYANCPAVPLVVPATITTSTIFTTGPWGNKTGYYYCPAGSVAVGFGPSNGDTYQNVPLICAALNATGTAYISGAYGGYPSTAFKDIDSSDSGGGAWCPDHGFIIGAEWAKNGQIDYGRCIGPESGLYAPGMQGIGGSSFGVSTGQIYAGSRVMCQPGYIATGFYNYPGKNDAWGELVCSKTYVDAPVSPPPAPSSGTINVTSENSVLTNDLVTSTWQFSSSSPADPCSTAPCTGTQQTYTNMPLGTYGVLPVTGSVGQGYSLRSVGGKIVAARGGSSFLSLATGFASELFNKAEAAVVCGFVNNGTSSCPVAQGLRLSSAGDTANFFILWDPVAAMSVNPTTVSSTVAAGASATMNVTIKNDGGQGSTLNWSASTSMLPSWLTVWPATGTLVAADSQALDFIANSSDLSAGTHTAKVAVTWKSQPSGYSSLTPTTIPVSFTVGAPAPPPPAALPPRCTFVASPQQIIPPEQSTLSWSCTNAVSCQLDGALVLTSGSETVSPPANTTYTLSCAGAGSGSTNTVTTQATVSVGSTNIHETNP